jgi:methanogenic corrinoid protein MtbC1
LYSAETVDHLRRIAEALEQGHRPAQVLMLTRTELDGLLGTTRPESHRHDDISGWMHATLELDAEGLASAFHSAHSRLGLIGFLTERAGPFLIRVGEAWESGELQIFHEHFASARLQEFLAATWRPLAEDNSGPCVVLATLPGEHHVLSLHMAASVLALEGCRIVFVGQDTPVADLRDCVAQGRARALTLAVAPSADVEATRAALTQLRAMVPTTVDIVVGGAGTPRDVAGIRFVESLGELPAVVASWR